MTVLTSDGRRLSPYERIKQAILNGDLAPGASLVETTLAEWCDVSRTPIREALTRLEQDGVAIRSDRGLIVRERSQEEILDIYETRIVLESTVARTAAVRRSELDLIHLRRASGVFGAVDPTDETGLARANRDFHRAVWRASHNESLSDMLERLNLHLGRYPSTTLSQPGRFAEACAEHAALVEAIQQHDGDSAARLAEVHFTKARDLRLSVLAEEAL
jgi:DNA-binding GntR family transcriptional regulator